MPQDETGGLLDLRRYLAPLIDIGTYPGAQSGIAQSGFAQSGFAQSQSGQPALTWDGPRSWWGGALDVEGLALGSLGALVEALEALSRARNAPHRVSTSAGLVAASFDSIRHLRVAGTPPDVWAPMSGFRPTRDG